MKNDEPAFPVYPDAFKGFVKKGLSIRDYFAGQALAGLAFNIFEQPSADRYGSLARKAYKIADAMLAEMEKEND